MSADLGSQPTPSGRVSPSEDSSGDQLPPERRTRPDAPPDSEQAGQTPATAARRAWSLVSEWLVVGVCALGLALLLKTFLVEVFVIPSGSMAPTLMVDNRVVVYKLGYRLHDVNRGDVVVFHQPGQAADADDLIKRVVALEGETFEIRGTQVYIDGARLEEPYLPPAGATHPTVPIPGCDNDPEPERCVVPEGKILVLGDNRPDSRDGRYFGPIDVDTVVGRAFFKLWPPNDLGGV